MSGRKWTDRCFSGAHNVLNCMFFRTSCGNRAHLSHRGEFGETWWRQRVVCAVKPADICTNRSSSPVGQPNVRGYQRGGQTEQTSSCGNLHSLHLCQIHQTRQSWSQWWLQLCHWPKLHHCSQPSAQSKNNSMPKKFNLKMWCWMKR